MKHEDREITEVLVRVTRSSGETEDVLAVVLRNRWGSTVEFVAPVTLRQGDCVAFPAITVSVS